MHPRTLRTAVVFASAAALAVATIAPSAAEAPDAGVGASSGSASLLTLALGDGSLGLRLVGEDAQTTNDKDAGPLAIERLSPFQIESSLLPALNALSQPSVETRSTSGEDVQSSPTVDLGGVLAGGPVPGAVSGTIDAFSVRSAVDAVGAVSSVQGAVKNLTVLGGLLRAGNASVGLGSAALVTDAGAERELALESLEVLDLTALLSSLGISLADLPIDVAIRLLDSLGLPLPGGLSVEATLATVNALLADTADVRSQVAALNAQIDVIEAQVPSLTSQAATASSLVTTLSSELATQQGLLAACVALCGPIQTLVNSLTADLAAANAALATANAALSSAQAQIASLIDQVQSLLATIAGALGDLTDTLNAVVAGLDGAALVVVDGLVAGVTARADDTLASSVAEVSASIGAVRVGGIALPGLALGAPVAQVTALADLVTSTVGDLLVIVDPALAGVVDIDLLEQSTSLDEAGGFTTASAAVTALRATITPPDVCGVLSRLSAVPTTVGSLLGDLGLPALPVGGPVADLLGAISSTVTCNVALSTVTAASLVDGVATALTQPITVEALSVAGSATYATAQTTGGSANPDLPTLPRTGGSLQFMLLALGAGAMGLAGRWMLLRTS